MVGARTLAHRQDQASCRSAVLRDHRTHPRPRLVGHRREARATSHRARSRGPEAIRTAPTPPRARRRAIARGDPATADPAPAGPLAPLHDRHLSTRDLLRGGRLQRPRSASADDARQRRPGPVENPRERMMRSREPARPCRRLWTATGALAAARPSRQLRRGPRTTLPVNARWCSSGKQQRGPVGAASPMRQRRAPSPISLFRGE